MMEDNTEYVANRIWWKIFPPAFVSNIANFFMFQVGLLFTISRFCSKEDLVIYSSFIPFWYIISCVDSFFAYASSQSFAICKGAGEQEQAQNIFSESLTAFIFFIICTVSLGCLMMPDIVRFLNIPQDLQPRATLFGMLMLSCVIIDSFANFLREFVRSDSMPRAAATISLCGSSAFFISMFICLGGFHKGVLACPILLNIANFIDLFVYSGQFLRKKATLKIRLRLMRWQTFKKIFILSGSSVINNGCGFIIESLLVRGILFVFGQAAITIYAVCDLLMAASYYLETACISSMQSMTGMFLGEKNAGGMRFVLRRAMVCGGVIHLILISFVLFFAPMIVHWFSVQENFAGEAVLALRICSFATILRHLFRVCCGFYNVSGHSKMISACSLTSLVGIYFLWILCFLFVVESECLFWFYLPVSWLCCLIFVLIVAAVMKRKKQYPDILLIPRFQQDHVSYYFLLQQDAEVFQDYRIMLQMFLTKQHVDASVISKIQHLFEELFIFASEKFQQREKTFFSIVTSVSRDYVKQSLRYDSSGFCLNSVLDGRQLHLSPDQLAGVRILACLSDDIYIDRIYGFNYISLTLYTHSHCPGKQKKTGPDFLAQA